jgi:isopenicillin N synthase-like dioxygenase
MSATSDERRTLLRQRSFLQGRLYFNNRRSSLDCLVRDISSQGAKLKVSDSIAIPEFVELYIPNKDETYRAKVQWRTGFEIGVTFENDQDSPSIVPGAAPVDLPERVRRLEAEVASLHRKLNELQNELRHGQGSGI